MAGVRRPGALEAEGFATVHRLDGVAELRGRIVRSGERLTRRGPGSGHASPGGDAPRSGGDEASERPDPDLDPDPRP
jgi:hypothetical protein